MAPTKQEINRLEDRIDQQITKGRNAMTFSVVGGIVVVVILIIYFSWASGWAREMSQPETVTEIASDKLVEQIPEVRRVIEREAKANAPEIVDDLLDAAINEQLPNMRQRAQNVVKEEVEKAADKYQAELMAAVDDTLSKHGENIRTMSENLTTPEGKQAFEDELYEVLDEAIQAQDIQVELQGYAIALKEIDYMLTELSDDGQEFSPQQEQLYRVVAILRELANRSEIGTLNLAE